MDGRKTSSEKSEIIRKNGRRRKVWAPGRVGWGGSQAAPAGRDTHRHLWSRVSQATKVLHILLTGEATLALKDYDAFRQTVTQQNGCKSVVSSS